MSVPPESEPRRGRRFRCLNCPRFYECRREDQRFCSDACRKEFHRYGGGYAKLREHVEKMVRAEVRRVLGEIIDDRIRDQAIDGRLAAVHQRIDSLTQRYLRLRRLLGTAPDPGNGAASRTASPQILDKA
jgi:hypothetical protein